MQIELQCHGLSPDARLTRHVQHRLARVLGRFRDHVQGARVSLRDVNGPRGGTDKHCTVLLRVKGGSDIILREREASALGAFDRAAGRVVVALVRRLERRRRGRGAVGIELLPAG